jgi:hypothetical protein
MTQASGSSDRQRLRRKYLSLGLGELTAAAVFALVGAVEVAPRLEQQYVFAFWSTLTPLLLILVQMGFYWLLARSWVANHPMPSRLALGYRAFRIVDALALLWALAAILLWSPSAWGMVGFLAVWAFGVIEFVNYFVVRLAYPVGSWLGRVKQRRRPQLVKDITYAA